MTSWDAFDAAIYSPSRVDRAVTDCFLDCHEIAAPFILSATSLFFD
jgi:hypothetical protein